jgi:glycine/D-amino acid oxidase-like deaminating enzyme
MATEQSDDVLIVGAGIFGVTAALELRRRGHRVGVIDPGPLPHPLAESTDISKVVRLQYGADEQYTAMGEAAIAGWRRWNAEWDEPLYHEVGVTMLTRQPMVDKGYEYESYQLSLRRGYAVERLNADEIVRRFPAWKPGAYVDGYWSGVGGFAESGRVVEALIRRGEAHDIRFHAGQTAVTLLEEAGRVNGVATREGERFHAEQVVICAGTWTPLLLPELAPVMKSTGHPVFHLVPPDPALFQAPHFPVFTADIAATGWYGFPTHPRFGVVKIANHGVGQRLHPERNARVVTADDERALRTMLTETFPSLVAAPIVYTRRCVYGDTLDEHFWIDRHPARPDLTVAAGGSGHGFKFGPVLGGLIADAVEGKPNEWLPKFRWRHLGADVAGQEAARFHG